ncbi:hypothetical protein [Synechococcus sp. UW140]|uniref:hypothetical protein n=1 Tax=Synechococcus sp. UW140 TaxID=368503 RepID=UPI003137F09F
MKTSGTQNGCVQLIAERQLCFESVVVAIEAGELLDVFEHPNQQRYPGQRVLVVQLEGYVHLVPYVETAEQTTAMPQQNPAIQLDAEEQQLNPWGNPNAA